MEASATRALVTDGIAEYSTEMVTIVGAVVVVIVGFFVLRAGLRWLATIEITSDYPATAYEFNQRQGEARRKKSMYRTNKNYDDYENEMVVIR